MVSFVTALPVFRDTISNQEYLPAYYYNYYYYYSFNVRYFRAYAGQTFSP